jgi:hypothetical protein
MRSPSLLRDPLAHFLIAGGLLFGVYRVVQGPQAPATADSKTITVDRPSLLRFMQYESMAFKPDYFRNALATLPANQQRELIDRYVREEALFREASAMGLAEGDYVIRRRLVQKMLYLLDDTATESFAPSEATVLGYFHAHEDRYREAPTVTFTQVFVDAAIVRPEGGERAAERLKRELEAHKVGFDQAPGYGDRPPYLQNYIKRTAAFVENQLGASFAADVTELQPSDHWQGPIRSTYGYHLVLVRQHEAARLPQLAQIRSEVSDDLLRDVVAAYREKAIKDLITRYKVQTTDVGNAAGAPAMSSARVAASR